MPKGQYPKVKGAICNVPVDTEEICDVLPRPAENNGLLFVKLKRKLEYKGHVYFEPVRPEKIRDVLQYLKANNYLYADTEVDMENVPIELCFVDDVSVPTNSSNDVSHIDYSCSAIYEEMSDSDTSDSDDDSDTYIRAKANPLDNDRIVSNETSMLPKFPIQAGLDNINIAPGEGRTPIPIFSDDNCEEMAFPHLFPTGKFGYQVDRDINLSPVRYFNQRFLNYTQKFASDVDYIFLQTTPFRK